MTNKRTQTSELGRLFHTHLYLAGELKKKQEPKPSIIQKAKVFFRSRQFFTFQHAQNS